MDIYYDNLGNRKIPLHTSDEIIIKYKDGELLKCNLKQLLFIRLKYGAMNYNLDKIKKVFNRIKLLKEIKK